MFFLLGRGQAIHVSLGSSLSFPCWLIFSWRGRLSNGHCSNGPRLGDLKKLLRGIYATHIEIWSGKSRMYTLLYKDSKVWSGLGSLFSIERFILWHSTWNLENQCGWFCGKQWIWAPGLRYQAHQWHHPILKNRGAEHLWDTTEDLLRHLMVILWRTSEWRGKVLVAWRRYIEISHRIAGWTPFFPFFWWAKLQDAPQNDRKIM